MDPSKKTGDEVWYSRNVSSVCFLSDTRRQIRITKQDGVKKSAV
jgi:hypothetical protein